MTNYINSITVENVTYPIGPFWIDNSNNIVNRDTVLSDTFSSNIIICHSHDHYSLDSVVRQSNIIVGDPSLNSEFSLVSNVIVGHENAHIAIGSSVDVPYVHLSAGGAFIGIEAGSTRISNQLVGKAELTIGPITVTRLPSLPGSSIVTDGNIGPLNIYAFGSCTYSNASYQIVGYVHAAVSYSTVDDVQKPGYVITGGTMGTLNNVYYKCDLGGDVPKLCFGASGSSIFCVAFYNGEPCPYTLSEVYYYSYPGVPRYN